MPGTAERNRNMYRNFNYFLQLLTCYIRDTPLIAMLLMIKINIRGR